jgi:transketolase
MTATTATAPSAATIEASKQKAKRLSILSMMSTTAAGSGHPTSCLSAAELVAGTFFYGMHITLNINSSPRNAVGHRNAALSRRAN